MLSGRIILLPRVQGDWPWSTTEDGGFFLSSFSSFQSKGDDDGNNRGKSYVMSPDVNADQGNKCCRALGESKMDKERTILRGIREVQVLDPSELTIINCN